VALHVELRFQFVDLSTVKFFEAGQLVLETIVFDGNVLILMEEVVDFELEFGKGDIFAAELVLDLDQFVFELDAQLALIIQIVLQLVLSLLELFPFIL
jgi:hypothetical protein